MQTIGVTRIKPVAHSVITDWPMLFIATSDRRKAEREAHKKAEKMSVSVGMSGSRCKEGQAKC